MNVFALLLATLCSISVNLTSQPSPTADRCEPILQLQTQSGTEYISVEEYVCAVVMHEMPYTFEAEALKAQAVAARTHLAYCMENSYPYHENADVCTDINHCRGYITKEEYAARYGNSAAEKAYAAARSAAESTRGEILTYNGSAILSVWHSSSYRFTEDSGNVWLTSLPYLSPVSTPETADVSTVTFTFERVREILTEAGYHYSGTTPIIADTTEYGRCAKLTIGSVTIDGTVARRHFSLRSTVFSVIRRDDAIEFTVYGYGHGVGMSQYGADAMASDGYGYREILSHYYNGTELYDMWYK